MIEDIMATADFYDDQLRQKRDHNGYSTIYVLSTSIGAIYLWSLF